MATIATFKELIVWQKGMAFATAVYHETERFPIEERFELARQLRRAAASIPTNIAEGFSRRSRAAYRNHISIALGSQGEMQTLIELAKRLTLLDPASADRLADAADELGRLLHGLWRALGPVAVCYSCVLFCLSLGPWA